MEVPVSTATVADNTPTREHSRMVAEPWNRWRRFIKDSLAEVTEVMDTPGVGSGVRRLAAVEEPCELIVAAGAAGGPR